MTHRPPAARTTGAPAGSPARPGREDRAPSESHLPSGLPDVAVLEVLQPGRGEPVEHPRCLLGVPGLRPEQGLGAGSRPAPDLLRVERELSESLLEIALQEGQVPATLRCA